MSADHFDQPFDGPPIGPSLDEISGIEQWRRACLALATTIGTLQVERNDKGEKLAESEKWRQNAEFQLKDYHQHADRAQRVLRGCTTPRLGRNYLEAALDEIIELRELLKTEMNKPCGDVGGREAEMAVTMMRRADESAKDVKRLAKIIEDGKYAYDEQAAHLLVTERALEKADARVKELAERVQRFEEDNNDLARKADMRAKHVDRLWVGIQEMAREAGRVPKAHLNVFVSVVDAGRRAMEHIDILRTSPLSADLQEPKDDPCEGCGE